MKKKIILLFFALMLVLTSVIYATDNESLAIDSDLYLSDENQYSLDNKVSGNVFNVSSNFVLEPSSSIDGDLFVVAKTVSLKSDVTYSDTLSKDNEFAIDRINASAVINGNVYVVCTKFTMDPGVEIHGDLYIVSKSINIQKSSVISGNIFATAGDFTLNGRVENSVYVATQSFNTNYYCSIYKDLNLTADVASLNSVIRRNANIEVNTFITGANFLTYGDLDIVSDSFQFSGEVDGSIIVNSKTISFEDTKDGTSVKCLIKGDFNYSSESEIENIENYVDGNVVYSEYKQEDIKDDSKFNVKEFILQLFTFVIYVFVVAVLFTLINKNYLDKEDKITTGNIFACLGIGLLAILVVILVSILLFIINIGATLSFTLIFAFIFLLFISTPIFVLDIVKLFKERFNFYLGILLVSLALFLVYHLPFIGGLVSFLFTTIGSGRIIKKVLSNK